MTANEFFANVRAQLYADGSPPKGCIERCRVLPSGVWEFRMQRGSLFIYAMKYVTDGYCVTIGSTVADQCLDFEAPTLAEAMLKAEDFLLLLKPFC